MYSIKIFWNGRAVCLCKEMEMKCKGVSLVMLDYGGLKIKFLKNSMN